MPPTSREFPYLWNYEAITYTNDNIVTTAPVVIGTHGVDGINGLDGFNTATVTLYTRSLTAPEKPYTPESSEDTGIFSYDFSTGTFTPSYSNIWSTDIPEDNSSTPCWLTNITIINRNSVASNLSYTQ